VNTSQSIHSFESHGFKVVTVDALAIAEEYGLNRIVNTAMLGAFGGATGYLTAEALAELVLDMSPSRRDQNKLACLAGYRLGEERRKLYGNERNSYNLDYRLD
jgi:Pyruvate/2-oxoacid:ferredoxin oxidoreductase gamma subunit